MTEKFHCPYCDFCCVPRRGKRVEPCGSFEERSPLDDGLLTCTGCGGLSFESVKKLVAQGAKLQKTDKGYKGYIDRPKTERLDGRYYKFYIPHFSKEEVEELNKMYSEQHPAPAPEIVE